MAEVNALQTDMIDVIELWESGKNYEYMCIYIFILLIILGKLLISKNDTSQDDLVLE